MIVIEKIKDLFRTDPKKDNLQDLLAIIVMSPILFIVGPMIVIILLEELKNKIKRWFNR